MGTLVPGGDAGVFAAQLFEECALEGAGPVEAVETAEGSSGAICELESPSFTVARQALKLGVSLEDTEENTLSKSLETCLRRALVADDLKKGCFMEGTTFFLNVSLLKESAPRDA